MSDFIVSARKYRPLRFDEVVGQMHVTQTLVNALRSNHVAHAFLFSGPRGVGKTTCARILAKALNCESRGEDFEPCNTCSSCDSFNQQASFNIIELDGASNNKVENIRTLIDQVRIPPQSGSYKVFIIDEVHMLSSSAFNAFLKTLEEPPPHAIFILATTEKHKLLPTILSRCQIYDFRRIQIKDIVDHLQSISTQEKVKVEEDALHLVAQNADGALRDALSIYDRLVSFADGDITYTAAIDNLRVLDLDLFFNTVDAMLLGDLPTSLANLDGTIQNGFESIQFLHGLAVHLRNLLMCRDPKTLAQLEVGEKFKKRYYDQASMVPYSFIIGALDMINDADIHFARSSHKRLHIETALSRLTFLSRREIVELIPDKVNEISKIEVKTLSRTKPKTEPKTEPKAEASIKLDNKITADTDLIKEPIEITPPVQNTIAVEHEEAAIQITDSSSQPKAGESVLKTLLKEVEKEEEFVVKTEDLNIERVHEIWTSYTEKVESPSLKHVLKTSDIFVIDNEAIKIKVTGQVSKKMIQHEKGLLNLIREHFNKPTIDYSFEVVEDEELKNVIEKPVHLMTNKEKYELMVQENPLVHDFRKRFDLKIDHIPDKKM